MILLDFFRKYLKIFSPDSGKKDIAHTVMLCFGGGVLFGTALIQILPEVS